MVRQREIPQEFIGCDYQNDREFRVHFQRWMNQLWQEKDADMDRLLKLAET